MKILISFPTKFYLIPIPSYHATGRLRCFTVNFLWFDMNIVSNMLWLEMFYSLVKVLRREEQVK